MDLPPSASSPLRGRRSRFGFQYRVSADWITQCPLSVWVNAPTVGPDIEAIGLPGVRHATSSYTVRLQLPSVTTVGYRDSLSYACSSPSGHPSSRFAVRYVHEFCLMLLPDAPSLRLPLPCWCSPSVRSRWLSFLQLACHARRTLNDPRQSRGLISVSPSKGQVNSRLKAADSPTACSAAPDAAPLVPGANVLPHDFFVQPHRRNEIASSPETLAVKRCFSPRKFRAVEIALFPLMNPATLHTAYFGMNTT